MSHSTYSTAGSTHGSWLDDGQLSDHLRALTEEDLLIGLAGLGSLRLEAKHHVFDIYRAGHEFSSSILANLASGTVCAMESRERAREWVAAALKN